MPMRCRSPRISPQRFAAVTGEPRKLASRTCWRSTSGSRPSVMRTSRAKPAGSNAPPSGPAGPAIERSAAMPPPAATITSTCVPLATKCSSAGEVPRAGSLQPEGKRERPAAGGGEHALDCFYALRRQRGERGAARSVGQGESAMREPKIRHRDRKFAFRAQLEVTAQVFRGHLRDIGGSRKRPTRRQQTTQRRSAMPWPRAARPVPCPPFRPRPRRHPHRARARRTSRLCSPSPRGGSGPRPRGRTQSSRRGRCAPASVF